MIIYQVQANFACFLTVNQKKAKTYLLNMLDLKPFFSNNPKPQICRKFYGHKRGVLQFFFSGVFLFYIKIYYPVKFIVLKKKNLCNSHFYIVHMIYGFFDAYILLKLIPLLKPLHSLSFYFILEIECMYKWNHTNYDMTTLLKKSVIFQLYHQMEQIS